MKFVPKGWGFEKWIVNNEEYCGKRKVMVRDEFELERLRVRARESREKELRAYE